MASSSSCATCSAASSASSPVLSKSNSYTSATCRLSQISTFAECVCSRMLGFFLKPLPACKESDFTLRCSSLQTIAAEISSPWLILISARMDGVKNIVRNVVCNICICSHFSAVFRFENELFLQSVHPRVIEYSLHLFLIAYIFSKKMYFI
ncbi:hypothetical protein L7F22_038454 [Adiantum nelumboides]|nr:hypothetical protein [Adiantum nelumboides]